MTEEQLREGKRQLQRHRKGSVRILLHCVMSDDAIPSSAMCFVVLRVWMCSCTGDVTRMEYSNDNADDRDGLLSSVLLLVQFVHTNQVYCHSYDSDCCLMLASISLSLSLSVHVHRSASSVAVSCATSSRGWVPGMRRTVLDSAHDSSAGLVVRILPFLLVNVGMI